MYNLKKGEGKDFEKPVYDKNKPNKNK